MSAIFAVQAVKKITGNVVEAIVENVIDAVDQLPVETEAVPLFEVIDSIVISLSPTEYHIVVTVNLCSNR